MKSNEYETYDITDIVVEKAFKILLVVCRIKGVKCDRVSFSFRDFERKFLRKWSALMFKEFPYDHNHKMTISTDVSAAKIRYICNN